MQKKKKNGFPMPAAKNGFHILYVHPKIYTFIKKYSFLMPIYKKILFIFTTQKLDATAKNRFQIFILHPKKHTIEEKNAIFYVATITGPILKFFDQNPASAISGILANYAFRLYICTSVFNVVIIPY